MSVRRCCRSLPAFSVSRFAWSWLAALCFAAATSCAAAPQQMVIVAVRSSAPTSAVLSGSVRISGVGADSAFHAWFADLHSRYRDRETVLCLYGVVDTLGTAVPVFVRPVKIDSARINRVTYFPCTAANPAFFGALRYLGMWHPHPNNMCKASDTDMTSFRADTAAVIELVSCADSLVAVTKDEI